MKSLLSLLPPLHKQSYPLEWLNRCAVLVRPRQPCLDWASQLDPQLPVGPESARKDCTIYLVPSGVFINDAITDLKQVARQVFENELSQWSEDRSTWPKPRDWATFQQWFDLEVHTMLVDLVYTPIKPVDPSEESE